MGQSRGFSLMELSVVLIIIGLLMSGALVLHKNYSKKSEIYRNKENMELVSKAIMRFYGEYGRYPCPASMSKGPGDSLFGVSSDCTDTGKVAKGSCNNDYCVVEGVNGKRVRIGSVPFVQLKEGIDDTVTETVDKTNTKFTSLSNLEKYEDADVIVTDDGKSFSIGAGNIIDTNNNRFTYAVTESQATDGYVENGGDIRIISEAYYTSPVQKNILHDKADFVFLSHGADELGARTLYGTKTSNCVGNDQETENCDFPANAIFLDGLRYEAPGPAYFDDTVVHRSWLQFFHWEKNRNNTDNAYNLNQDGKVGVGLMDPETTLHVRNGNFMAFEKLMAEEICDENGNFCFDPNLIGGNEIAMDCNKGGVADQFKAMVGISQGEAQCEKFFVADQAGTCGAGEYLYGFRYNQNTRSLTKLCDNPLSPHH